MLSFSSAFCRVTVPTMNGPRVWQSKGKIRTCVHFPARLAPEILRRWIPRGDWETKTLDVARMAVFWDKTRGGRQEVCSLACVHFLQEAPSRVYLLVSWYAMPLPHKQAHIPTRRTHLSFPLSPLPRHTGPPPPSQPQIHGAFGEVKSSLDDDASTPPPGLLCPDHHHHHRTRLCPAYHHDEAYYHSAPGAHRFGAHASKQRGDDASVGARRPLQGTRHRYAKHRTNSSVLGFD